MKNYFKKFSIMFVMAFAIMLGCSTSVFATDNFVVGKSNLNNTPLNSAKVGDVLKLPEIGWKRYDDKVITEMPAEYGENVYFSSNGDPNGNSGCYNKAYTYFGGEDLSGKGSYIRFNFKGSKIRIITQYHVQRSNNVLIKIDDIKYRYDAYKANNFEYQVIAFEKIGLENREHTVEICVDAETNALIANGKSFKAGDIDAIDIGEDGELLPPEEIKPNPEESNDKTGAILIINLNDGETKVFDVSSSEIAKFKLWYNTKSEYENKLTYEFDKTVNSNISVEEHVVHEKITSFEIRKY